MSILKNFKNPWEADKGVLETNVLDTNVLTSNDLSKVLSNNSMMKQEIIPTIYIFVHDNEEDVSISLQKIIKKDLVKVKKDIIHIFKKNKISVNVNVIDSKSLKEKEQASQLNEYDLAIGITTKGNSIGLSTVWDASDYVSNVLRIFGSNSSIILCYINYDDIKDSQAWEYINIFRTAFLMAHEALHQMTIKSFASIFGKKDDNDFFPKWALSFAQSFNFNIHEDEELNLNTDAEKLGDFGINTIPSERSSKLRNYEKILLKHKKLLYFWLNPSNSMMPKLNPTNYSGN